MDEAHVVLRIYAGNVDASATFKTVSLTRTMTVAQVLEEATRRFRLPRSPGTDYCLCIAHMDSRERRLQDYELLFSLLERLHQQHVPGIGMGLLPRPTSPPANSGSSRALALFVSDNTLVRILINRRPAMMPPPAASSLSEPELLLSAAAAASAAPNVGRLVRVSMQDEANPNRLRVEKTIAVAADARVEDLLALAAHKFGLNGPPADLSLASVIDEDEKTLDRAQLLSEVPQAAQFVLQWRPSSHRTPESIGDSAGQVLSQNNGQVPETRTPEKVGVEPQSGRSVAPASTLEKTASAQRKFADTQLHERQARLRTPSLSADLPAWASSVFAAAASAADAAAAITTGQLTNITDGEEVVGDRIIGPDKRSTSTRDSSDVTMFSDNSQEANKAFDPKSPRTASSSVLPPTPLSPAQQNPVQRPPATPQVRQPHTESLNTPAGALRRAITQYGDLPATANDLVDDHRKATPSRRSDYKTIAGGAKAAQAVTSAASADLATPTSLARRHSSRSLSLSRPAADLPSTGDAAVVAQSVFAAFADAERSLGTAIVGAAAAAGGVGG
ncbi:hypothetical protein HK405_009776, partial [Cladochytrium tenue]